MDNFRNCGKKMLIRASRHCNGILNFVYKIEILLTSESASATLTTGMGSPLLSVWFRKGPFLDLTICMKSPLRSSPTMGCEKGCKIDCA